MVPMLDPWNIPYKNWCSIFGPDVMEKTPTWWYLWNSEPHSVTGKTTDNKFKTNKNTINNTNTSSEAPGSSKWPFDIRPFLRSLQKRRPKKPSTTTTMLGRSWKLIQPSNTVKKCILPWWKTDGNNIAGRSDLECRKLRRIYLGGTHVQFAVMNLAAYGEADAWTRPLDGFASISEGTVYTILQCIYIIQYTKDW